MIRRVWRAGVGCCIERSAPLSAEEANRLFHRVKIDIDAMHHRCLERDDASLTALKHDEAGGFLLIAMRQPDPDHPMRTAPEYLVEIIPRGELFILDDHRRAAKNEADIEHPLPAKVRWEPWDIAPTTPVQPTRKPLRSIVRGFWKSVIRRQRPESPH